VIVVATPCDRRSLIGYDIAPEHMGAQRWRHGLLLLRMFIVAERGSSFADRRCTQTSAHAHKITRAIHRNNGVELSGRADVTAVGKSAAHPDLLFNHADADFAALLPGLRALLNRIVRNAL
jgi:hypothetical protein